MIMSKKTGNNAVFEAKIKMPPHGIQLELHHHEPDFLTKFHFHKYPSIMYIISGQGTCKLVDQEHDLKPDQILFINAPKAHQLIDKQGTPMTIFVVYFDPDIVGIEAEILTGLSQQDSPANLKPLDSKPIRMALRQLAFEQQNKPKAYKTAVKQALYDILIRFYRQCEIRESVTKLDSNSRVQQVLDYVKLNYYRQLTLPESAKMSKLSERQFTNVCRQLTGKSFIKHLNIIRTTNAKKLLEETNMPVAGIAFEVGYEDLSTFYRAFKKEFNKSPLELRE